MLQPKMILFFLSFCLSFRLYIKQHSICWEFDCMRFPNDHRIFGNVNELRSLHTNVYSIVYRTFWIWTQERIANTMNHVAHSLFLIYIISAAFMCDKLNYCHFSLQRKWNHLFNRKFDFIYDRKKCSLIYWNEKTIEFNWVSKSLVFWLLVKQ